MSFAQTSPDALSSVFRLLSAADLKSALQLNRDCRSIVGAMGCAQLSVCYHRGRDPFLANDRRALLDPAGPSWLDHLCSSSLARKHVTQLDLFEFNCRDIGPAELELLWSGLPALRSLITHLGRALPAAAPVEWRFPSSLTSLDVGSNEWRYDETARSIAIALRSAVSLTKLALRHGCDECCPLSINLMPQLRELYVDLPSDLAETIALIDRIRAHPAITDVGLYCWSVGDQSECVTILDRLTAPPSSADASSSQMSVVPSCHRLRRLTFRGIPFDSRTWPLLTSERCPALQRLSCGASESVRYLLQFPKLTSLSLGFAHQPIATADWVESLSSLHCLERLTLGVSAGLLLSRDLAAVLIGMPLLAHLDLSFANTDFIDSLAFFAAAAAAGSLHRLRSVTMMASPTHRLEPRELLSLLPLPSLEFVLLARIVDSTHTDYAAVLAQVQSDAKAQGRRLILEMVH